MKWGIMATGNIAAKFAKTVNSMGDKDEILTGVGSRDLKRAESFAREHGILKVFGSYEELAACPEVEAVYIATPNNMHFENAMLCLKAGKHVLCEKPFTTNAGDARLLYEEAASSGLFIMEAFWIRFLPLYEKLLEIIRTKEYGELLHARCDYGFIAKGDRRTRKFRSELGGGALLDIGIYNLGFLYMVMGGAPVDFTSRVRFNEYGTDWFSSIMLTFPGDRTAQCAQSIGLSMQRHAALYFEKAEIFLPDFQGAFFMTINPVEGESITMDFPPLVNGFEYEIKEASECVNRGLSCSERFRPEDSIAILKLMDDIRKSWNMKFSFEK